LLSHGPGDYRWLRFGVVAASQRRAARFAQWRSADAGIAAGLRLINQHMKVGVRL